MSVSWPDLIREARAAGGPVATGGLPLRLATGQTVVALVGSQDLRGGDEQLPWLFAKALQRWH